MSSPSGGLLSTVPGAEGAFGNGFFSCFFLFFARAREECSESEHWRGFRAFFHARQLSLFSGHLSLFSGHSPFFPALSTILPIHKAGELA